MHGQCEAEDKRGKHAATRHHMVTRHGGTCLVGAELSAVRNVTPRQVSDSQVNNHTSEYNTIPALMSEMVTMISDAANDATTTVGGGGTQEGSEKGKDQHSEQRATQVQDPQTRFADTSLGLHFSCLPLVCGIVYLTLLSTDCRTKRRGPLQVLQRAQCAAVLCTIASAWHA